MKRSPLKRYTELKATSPMKRGKPLTQGGGPKRKAAPKLAKPKGVPAVVKRILLARSGGVCEVGLTCRGMAPAQDPAHREGKKAGGTKKEWSNSPSCLLAACRDCHRLIDGLEVRGAEHLGLKIREGVARPWEVPVKLARLGWVLLDNDGGHRPAPAGSHAEGKRPVPVVACSTWELIQQNGNFAEAMERYKHHQCPGWSAPREGLFTCGCGSTPFYLEEVAS